MSERMKYRERVKTSSRCKRIGIKWKMFAILISFVFVFALAIWVFQIRMLNFFYQNEKFEELKNTVDAISLSSVEDGEIKSCISGYDFCVFLDKDKYALKGIEKLGIPVFNAYEPITVCDDKMLTFLKLAHSA